MTSSSETNRSSYSDDGLDNLYKGPGMRCSYTIYPSTCEDSSESPGETFEYTINEAENEETDICGGDTSPIEINRSEPKTDEDIGEQATLPPDGNQKYLLEQIRIQMQTHIDGLKDTMLKEIREIRDTQREIQRDLVRLKATGHDGDGSVTALHYEPYRRRAQYAVRPLSTAGTQTNLSVETQTSNSESWVVKPDPDILITCL
ncbi:uncharacterized protein [Haliotis cracherodii]|uniref:uncharacterized protein n=1 Tax=Haliotis cracherodii TaxID=6455 RepID=UPI0039ECD93B